jgi:hypothetical protein
VSRSDGSPSGPGAEVWSHEEYLAGGLRVVEVELLETRTAGRAESRSRAATSRCRQPADFPPARVGKENVIFLGGPAFSLGQ